eukprot:TRINITY_DN36250_c0_g1_i1.p2 TRINITY_DN36250_c0_g1~~TRINITY_DN36250_c0_g1_i1.p2  ORF type:complete len:103 (+),score=12.75 TRINITY_DN36250_c0_g1_i1:505-813(+)
MQPNAIKDTPYMIPQVPSEARPESASSNPRHVLVHVLKQFLGPSSLRGPMLEYGVAILQPRKLPVLCVDTVSYTHLRAHETPEHLVCRLLLEKKKKKATKHR